MGVVTVWKGAEGRAGAETGEIVMGCLAETRVEAVAEAEAEAEAAVERVGGEGFD